MKKRFLVTTLMLAVMMIMAGTATVSADVSETAYNYTIKVYAGQQGHFEAPSTGTVSNGGKTLTITVPQGEMVTIDQSTTGFKLDSDEYYLRGFRETGHDNDEEMSVASFIADEDISYEAAYGLKGGMVKYTIQYLDENDNALRKSQEFYGMVGDKPVVSFRYVEGYQPNAYNLTKTLSANEAENFFAFTYSKNSRTAVREEEEGGATGGNGAAGNGAAGNGAAGAAPAGTNIGDNATPQAGPQGLVDLDNNQTPMAGGPGNGAGTNTTLPDDEVPLAGINPIALIGGSAALLAAIAAIAIALARRRRDEDDEGVAYQETAKQE